MNDKLYLVKNNIITYVLKKQPKSPMNFWSIVLTLCQCPPSVTHELGYFSH